MSLVRTFEVTVPGTNEPLHVKGAELRGSGHTFTECADGIWDLTRPDRREALDTFALAYARVRAAEQRELTPEEVRSLPSIHATHPLAGMWEQRAASFARFKKKLHTTSPGVMVDIGAGCGWLSADLSRAGWTAAAVDVTVDGGDGLAAARHHDVDLFTARAEMAALPFAANSMDLAVFNAALHYAANVKDALREAHRVVRPGGVVAVLDSPVFKNPVAGHKMVREFEEHSRVSLGIEAAPLEGPGFVTEDDLSPFDFDRDDAEHRRSLSGQIHKHVGALRARREVATRPLLISRIGEPS